MVAEPQEFAIQVMMRQPIPPSHAPSIEVIDTEVDTHWIIGARDIVLTDPPVPILPFPLGPGSTPDGTGN